MSRATVPPIDDGLLPPGTVICEGTIPGRAVPWKAPKICRRKDGRTFVDKSSRGYGEFVAWQQSVALAARSAMRRRVLYRGPVELRLAFYLRHRPGGRPDLTNMVKSTEDGIEGAVIENDSQVCRVVSRRVMSSTEAERCEFVVIAID